ncbi:dicarboxylate/amino acid:cation symporter [Oceanicoccus sagamiensis]|uniref:Dicarboxylate/amino acid:cation symporter n=1 Tax=Oceanicoccus sagamiensis TaxID=716816 RepID=A0A1X9N9Q2_9GAMM|nr:dicarboxylate/amino acid:cation symporter [Oceanicoccus sagamiensis]ARN73911.1 dicarboxylate/amino acid:cation symporter [Oceanicoccus sagamiensis]
MIKLELHWQILIAIIAAGLAGMITGTDTSILGVSFYAIYGFIGTLFLNALKMIIVPLVMSSIITGISGIGSSDNLGRLGGKTILFYATTSLLAILVGLVLVNITAPGLINGEAAGEQLNLSTDANELALVVEKVEGKGASDISDVFLRLVPTNVVAAAAGGQMLGLIFFSLLFGFFMTRIDDDKSAVLKNFWQAVFDTMMHITMWVMKFAPVGVFGLVAKTVASTGFAAFSPLLIFFVTVVAALAIHAFVTLPILLRVMGRVRPGLFIKKMSPVMLTAFSTASSSATLPLTLETVEKEIGVSNKTTSFVLPLGATINMDGTALYECVAAMFIAQAYGLDLTIVQQFTIVLVALLTSIGVAGIPAASLVAITVILGVIGLPLEGLGLLLVTDRILDMMRTAVNVYSDSCGAVIIARSEGEETNIAS